MMNLKLLTSVYLFFALVQFSELYAQDNWFSQNSGTTKSLNDVVFVDSLRGWVVGDSGAILMTTNGGDSWQLQQSNTLSQLRSVCFPDTNNGWIVGSDGTVLKTTNEGVLWEKIEHP